MPPTHEDRAERCELDAVLIKETNGAYVYVCYPVDATDEELKTMWIRSAESDLTQLADHQ